jgi:4-carboxymuconolactone decarboxylase
MTRSAGNRELLRHLAEADGGLTPPSRDARHDVPAHGLDPRMAALARLAALVALRAAPASYRRGVACAFAAGASVDDVVDTLKVVARAVGLARVVSAAPALALAAGYDIDTALEALDEPPEPPADDQVS